MANKNEDKKFHFLYKTVNVLNNKYYYGIHSTNKIEDGYLGSGVYLTRAIRKHGKDNFKREIIKQFDNRADLVKAEESMITKEMLKDKQNMNCQFGGEYWNTLGMMAVSDKNGNRFNVFVDDPRLISGELVSINKGKAVVKDKDGNIFQVDIDYERYLNGELVSITKGFVVVKDINGNIEQVSIEDPRYLSGELVSIHKGKITVKDKNGIFF